MKLALTSDTHGMMPSIPRGTEAIVHAGDIGVDRDAVNWFRDVLYPWARQARIPIYATFGNHDFVGQDWLLPPGRPDNLNFIVDQAHTINGVKFWFTPWSLRFFDWAFMADEDTLTKKYALIDPDTQVIVTHGPPLGAGDKTTIGIRTGSKALAQRMTELSQLKLVVTGHIHEAHGEYLLKGVRVLNVSYVDEIYRPRHKPTIVDI